MELKKKSPLKQFLSGSFRIRSIQTRYGKTYSHNNEIIEVNEPLRCSETSDSSDKS